MNNQWCIKIGGFWIPFAEIEAILEKKKIKSFRVEELAAILSKK
jgi:hypothetical protein